MITFRVDDTNLRRKANAALKQMGQTQHPRHPLVVLDREKKRRLGAKWRAANVTRDHQVEGQRWAKFRPPPDPPWGGRRKKRGQGVTLGRKRPSGRRLTANSRMMIDTWALYRAVVMQPPDIIRNVLYLGRGALHQLRYARRQLSMRPLGWTAEDQQVYRRAGRAWLDWIATQWNRDQMTRTFAGRGVRRSDVA